jgi:hypothetical protein
VTKTKRQSRKTNIVVFNMHNPDYEKLKKLAHLERRRINNMARELILRAFEELERLPYEKPGKLSAAASRTAHSLE